MRLLSRTIFFLILGLLPVSWSRAQVTTEPAFPNGEEAIKIIIDAKLANDSRASGLLGLTDDVFLWSGAGSTENGNAFEFGPTGQSDFNLPYEPGRMTFEGNDIWSITITPRTYFNVPNGTPIRRLGVLLKNGDGTAQTEDFFITLFESGLNLNLMSPALSNLFVDPGETIAVSAQSSEVADWDLLVDGSSVTTQSNTNQFSFDLVAENAGSRSVELRAIAGSDTARANFNYSIIAPLPEGLLLGINYRSDTEVALVFQAPLKDSVKVMGDFNNWDADNALLMEPVADGNTFRVELNNLTPGEEYAFQYIAYENGSFLRIADPFADKYLFESDNEAIVRQNYPNLKAYPSNHTSGPVSVLQTAQTPYVWQTSNFTRPEPQDLVVYELLVRDFDQDKSYQNVIDRLDYLDSLGINAIELMPIMEFGGNQSWGYNPWFYFAPDKAYGPKDKLKELIDKAHARGMAVILDMVLNQADFEFPYVKMYFEGGKPRADNPWFNRDAKHPFNVFFDFNHESPFTQTLVDTVNRYWIQEYRFDGYRFDLSKGFTQRQTTDVGLWSSYDASRVALLKRMADKIWEIDADAYVILEHLGVDEEERELTDYGMMIWGKMTEQFKQLSLGFNENTDFSRTFYQNRSGNWTNPAAVVAYMESHDEQRIMYENQQFGNSSGDYDIKDFETGLNRIKAAAALFYTIPGPKMLWQFGEVGYDFHINYCPDGQIRDECRVDPKPIRWDYQADPERNKLYKTFSALINLRRSHDIFRTDNLEIVNSNGLLRSITLRPANNTTEPLTANEMTVYIIGNFDVQAQNTNLIFPHAGTWYDYFSGSTAAPIQVTNVNVSRTLRPGEFRIYTNFPLNAPAAELMPFVKPKAATDLAATSISGTEIQLTWTDPSSISNIFRVFRATSAEGPFSQISLIDASTTNFTDSGLNPETEYFYYIATQSEVDTSNSAIFSVSTVTSVEDPILAAAIQLYPNPAPRKIRLSLDRQISGNIQIQLWNAQGNLLQSFEILKQFKEEDLDLELPDLAQGLYLLRFRSDKGQATKRLVIE